MKKFIKYLTVLVLSVFAISCEKDYMENNTFTPVEPELSFEGENALEVDKMGGEFSFKFKSNLPWIVDIDADWIMVDGEDRGMGSDDFIQMNCTVQTNKSLDPRTATIRVRIDDEHEAVMTVKQHPMDLSDLGSEIYVKVDGTGDGSSWATATTLSKALADAMDGDIIHVAAGTYVPENAARNTDAGNPANKTFELAVNATIIGGYPADAQEGAVANPETNMVTLSGNDTQYRVLVVSAMKSEHFTAKVQGVTITRGAGAGSSDLSINGAQVKEGYGAGVTVAGSNFILENCIVSANKSKSAPGMFNCDGANTVIDHCSFVDNAATANGANIWNSYATLTIKNSKLLNNKTSHGVGGAVYLHGDSKMTSCPNTFYCYNTLFEGNATDASVATRRGGGIYAREGSKSVIVNCTFKGNRAGNGSAIALYGKDPRQSSMTIISCTISGNETTANGAVEQCPMTTMRLYNTIISGNTATGSGATDLIVSENNAPLNGILPETISYCIVGQNVYDRNNNAVTGQTFDASTMLTFENGVFKLTGDNNPAKTLGMPANELQSISSGMEKDVPLAILTSDQNGKERTVPVMGASVE